MEIMGAVVPRTVPGIVCVLLDKQLFSLRAQALGVGVHPEMKWRSRFEYTVP